MEIVEELMETVDKEVCDMLTSKKIVRRITRDFGGSQIYIPQERFAFREDFENEVYADFNGCNIRELSRKYGISKSTVHTIIKDARRRHRKQNEASQGRLL